MPALRMPGGRRTSRSPQPAGCSSRPENAVNEAAASDQRTPGRSQGPPPVGRVAQGLTFAVMVAALATIPLVLTEQQGVESLLVDVGDWLAWVVFVVEYAVFLGLAPDRRSFVRTNGPRAALILIAFPVLRPL